MATIIHERQSAGAVGGIPEPLRAVLPSRLLLELRESPIPFRRVEEIRLRLGRRASITTWEGNRLLRCVLDQTEMEGVVRAVCGGSLYAYRDAIAQGYLTMEGGIRMGLCGRASVEDDKIVGVYDITGINFRIPTKITRLGLPVCRLLRGTKPGGVLIYAPPGVGKTTLLRCVASQMASGDDPRRVVVIDTRGELQFSLDDPDLCLDVLIGYPRPLGISIATRTMNAQLIVCDEIGDVKEAEAIVSAQNSGIPFVASAHADCVEGLLKRTGIYRLHRARIFHSYVGIRRRQGSCEFDYEVTSWEEADAIIQNYRSGNARS